MSRWVLIWLCAAAWAADSVAAQATPQSANNAVVRARVLYDDLDFGSAISVALSALNDPSLSETDQAEVWEILGYSYGSLDSAQQAQRAFREMIFLEPDREPDPVAVASRIMAAYSTALSSVLVIRKVQIDSSSFVAGQGNAAVRFQMSRSGEAVTRIVGQGVDETVDSLVLGAGQVSTAGWSSTLQDGSPVPPGRYEIFVTATDGPDEFVVRRTVEVRHSPVDTLVHLDSLPGFSFLPDSVRPGRSFRPLGIAALYTALASGAALALENTDLAHPSRTEIGGVGFVALVTGLVLSLKRPDPVAVPANIRFNALHRQLLAEENGQRADENASRRRQTMLTLVPVEER